MRWKHHTNISTLTIFLRKQFYFKILKYFTLFRPLKSRFWWKFGRNRKKKNWSEYQKFYFSAHVSQFTQKAPFFDYFRLFWGFNLKKFASIQILFMKQNFDEKKSGIIFLISWFQQTSNNHLKSNCSPIRNLILNNLSEKISKKIKAFFVNVELRYNRMGNSLTLW